MSHRPHQILFVLALILALGGMANWVLAGANGFMPVASAGLMAVIAIGLLAGRKAYPLALVSYYIGTSLALVIGLNFVRLAAKWAEQGAWIDARPLIAAVMGVSAGAAFVVLWRAVPQPDSQTSSPTPAPVPVFRFSGLVTMGCAALAIGVAFVARDQLAPRTAMATPMSPTTITLAPSAVSPTAPACTPVSFVDELQQLGMTTSSASVEVSAPVMDDASPIAIDVDDEIDGTVSTRVGHVDVPPLIEPAPSTPYELP
ncbi:MAG: hypothetical protein AAF432_06400 [Planctomycetota bacterium]